MSAANKEIALRRIHRLFELAKNTIRADEELAQRYIAIARTISMAARVRVPREYRRQICRRCKRFILPGVNCRVRIQRHREPHIVFTCQYCGKHVRFAEKQREKEKHDKTKNTTKSAPTQL